MGWVRLMAAADAVIQTPAPACTCFRVCRSEGTLVLLVLLLVLGDVQV